MSRLKIAKFQEYFENKREGEILKRIQFCMLKICKYNCMVLSKPYKLLPSIHTSVPVDTLAHCLTSRQLFILIASKFSQ